jgi:hypothetical protein
MVSARLLPARIFQFVRCCCVRRSLLFVSLAVLPASLAAQAQQSSANVPFRLRDGYLMIVRTSVNGAGPFDFLLDTGTTRTVIDPELAQQLQAPVVGGASLTGILHVRQDKLVQLREIRLGNASLSGLGAVVDLLARQKTLAPGIRGVLGEDFLSKFDFLIDYRRHCLRFGDPPPGGERYRFETIGQYHGAPTTNRLLIAADLMASSTQRVVLQLDTAARMPELFPPDPDAHPSEPWRGSMAASSGADGFTVYSNVTIRVGTTLVRGMDVLQSRRAIQFDAAGLLPGAIFRSIYISHSHEFVVLNPVE